MAPPARSDLLLTVLASGSGGNCTYLGDGGTGLLVDAGISARQILQRMAAAGLADAPIDALLITHEHRDHVQGARVLLKRLATQRRREIPCYMSRGTAGNLPQGAEPHGVRVLECGRAVDIGSARVHAFPISHDTAEPVGYRVELAQRQVVVVTDLGRPTALVRAELARAHIAVLEFNHDEEMLLQGPYPWWLKQRVRGSHGHLSNDQAGRLLEEILSPQLRHVVMAHLSQKNNRPARALAAAQAALRRANAQDSVKLTVATQWEPTPLIRLCSPASHPQEDPTAGTGGAGSSPAPQETGTAKNEVTQ